MTQKSIGQFIAALRRVNGMTQQEMADRLNVSNKAVSRWERDECMPDLTLIPAIAEMFHVTCDELLKGERILRKDDAKDIPPRPEPRVDRQIKILLKQTTSKFNTLIAAAFALSAIGFILMLGIAYGFYRPAIGFAVCGVCEVVAVVLSLLSLSRVKSTLQENEILEAADDAVRPFAIHCGRLFTGSLFASAAALILSLPLLLIRDDVWVHSVLAFHSYFPILSLMALLLANVYMATEQAFGHTVMGYARPTPFRISDRTTRGLNILHLLLLAISTGILAIFIFLPRMIKVTEGQIWALEAVFGAGMILIIAATLLSGIYFLRRASRTRLAAVVAIRNLCLSLALFSVYATNSFSYTYNDAGTAYAYIHISFERDVVLAATAAALVVLLIYRPVRARIECAQKADS